jgi:hypothetical protein
MVKTQRVDLGSSRFCIVKELQVVELLAILEYWKKNAKGMPDLQDGSSLFSEFLELFSLIENCFQFSEGLDKTQLSVSELEMLFEGFYSLHESAVKKMLQAVALSQQPQKKS